MRTPTTTRASLRAADGALSRRLLLGTAAALSLSTPPLPLLAASGLSRTDVLSKLSRVPIFAVTNSEAAPYLTEVDEQGRRSGFFFISPQTAVAALNDIRAFDSRASLNVVPLDDIFFDISKTADECAKAPQPAAGTSTDLRLFRLQPLGDELKAAASLSSEKLAEGSVPLFYEPSLTLSVDGKGQAPYFFRFGDLQAAYNAQKAADGPQSTLNSPPKPRVATLAAVIAGLERGDLPADTLLVAASEAAAVVARMNSGGGMGLPAPTQAPERDPFFLQTMPFGAGKAPRAS